MFCPKCGAQNSNEYKFCGRCGAPLGQNGVVKQEVQESKQANINPAQVSEPSTKTVVAPAFDSVDFRQPTAFDRTDLQSAPTSSQLEAIKPAKGNKSVLKVTIPIVAVLLLLIIVFVLYQLFFSTKPCFRTVNQRVTDNGVTFTNEYEYGEGGALLETITIKDGANTTTKYKELVDGLTINADYTGKYEMNNDGYVSYYEIIDSSGKTHESITLEYYSPGIIKSQTIRKESGKKRVQTYNEDGWLVSVTGDLDPESFYDYVFSNNSKTVTVYSYKNSSHSSGGEVIQTLELDDNGNVITVYSGEKKTVQRQNTYEKIEHPDKMVQALAHLKAY